MSLAEALGAEDSPFSLFLILILLLGATGYFDKASLKADSAGESDLLDDDDTGTGDEVQFLPVSENEPQKLVRPFSAPAPSRGEKRKLAGVRLRKPRKRLAKKDLISALCEMLGLPPPSKALSLLRKALAKQRTKHPRPLLRHKMLQ